MNCARQVPDPAALLAALTPQEKYQIARLLEQAGEFETTNGPKGPKPARPKAIRCSSSPKWNTARIRPCNSAP